MLRSRRISRPPSVVDPPYTGPSGGGSSSGTTSSCTRSEMVTFLHRYDQKPAVTGTNKFVDVPSDAFYKDAVQWAVNKSITAGTNAEGTTFTPERACTRGEMAIFLHRFLGK